jgi:hypothetical protein
LDGSSVDAYLRIDATERAPDHFGEGAEGLVFVDLDVASGDKPDRLADQLRRAPRGFFQHARAVVVRWPATFGPIEADHLRIAAEQVNVLAGRGHDPIPFGGAEFAMGREPVITWAHEAPAEPNDTLLARARAVELAALLHHGRATWHPPAYHYQLPSKEHTDVFVRVADAMRAPRDAVVLATWLYEFVGPDLSVMLDSRTLLPVVLALSAELRSQGAELGPVVTLNEYAETDLEYRALAGRTGGAGTLAILTVSSSGNTRVGLAEALSDNKSGWRLETLFSRSGEQAVQLQHGQGISPAWLGQKYEAYPKAACPHCDGADKRPFVQIDAHNFRPLVLPDPPLLGMPDISEDHSVLLEWYEKVDGIGLECAPPRRTEQRRGKDPSAVRFYPHLLLKEAGFRMDAVARLDERLRISSPNDQKRAINDGWCRPDRFDGIDTFVMLDEDAKAEGFSELLDGFAERLGASDAKRVVFDNDPGPPDARDIGPTGELADSHNICVVTVGAVTGGTLQELLWRTHAAMRGRPKDAYSIRGLAVHARPATLREWRTLRNAYGMNLLALWVTYLPWRSVLDEEVRLLEQLPDGEEVDSFWTQRRSFCKPLTSAWDARRRNFDQFGGVHPASVFWGTDAPEGVPHLFATSRFGHELGPIAAFVGMGASMQRARLDSHKDGAPPWLHFQMADISSSYFDTLLIVATLRWLEPYEGHWAADGRDVETILNSIWHRVQGAPLDERVLLSELLLAAAQAKLPRTSEPWLRSKVEEVRGRWGEGTLGPVELGAKLLRLTHGAERHA